MPDDIDEKQFSPTEYESSSSSAPAHEPPRYERRSIMATGSARYVRYILFAVFGLAILYFISTSSLPQYTPPTAPPRTGAVGLGSPDVEKAAHDIPTIDTAPIPPSVKPAPAAAPTTPAEKGLTPNELSPPAPGERVNATFVTLARNTDIWEIARSIRQVEDRFNRNYNYDWVFLNDKPFDDTFKKVTTSLVSGKTHYGEIPVEHWSFPEWIDEKKAADVREDMRQRKIIYGDSVSYRHMCRYESGFFFRHPIMMNFEYYWRVEPSVELFCDLHYDPFRIMKDSGKKYSFVLSLYEYIETIPTLWESTKKFIKNHPEHIAADNSMAFLSDDGGETYNKCHFVGVFLFHLRIFTDITTVVQLRGGQPELAPLESLHRFLRVT
jgi:alpha 1,2-mannosyltransferase